MNRQTVDQAMSILNILQHPAFCIRNNGTLVRNEPANHVAPSCSAALPQWLGTAKSIYDLWDRSSNLQVAVTVHDLEFLVTIHPLQDGTLFLMAPYGVPQEAEQALSVTSQVLRQNVSDLSALLYQAEQTKEYDAAAFNRLLYRMTRALSNLTETGRLNANAPRTNIICNDTAEFFDSLLDEVEKLCQHAGRTFTYSLPRTSREFFGDAQLIRRAVLNLISNALKFSPEGSPISCRIQFIGTHLIFQIENSCTDNGSDLLRAAFNRLSHRGVLPDPKWGIGLGLPLANSIARLHGGMIAVETLDGKATVSLSISLQTHESHVLSSPIHVDYNGGMRQTLLELSDALPIDAFR